MEDIDTHTTLEKALIAIKNGIDILMAEFNKESEYIVLNNYSYKLLEPAIYKNKIFSLKIIIDPDLLEGAMVLPPTHDWQTNSNSLN